MKLHHLELAGELQNCIPLHAILEETKGKQVQETCLEKKLLETKGLKFKAVVCIWRFKAK